MRPVSSHVSGLGARLASPVRGPRPTQHAHLGGSCHKAPPMIWPEGTNSAFGPSPALAAVVSGCACASVLDANWPGLRVRPLSSTYVSRSARRANRAPTAEPVNH